MLRSTLLILWKIDPDTRPSAIGPPFTGHFRTIADTPRGLQAFQPAAKSIATPGKPFEGTERALSGASPSKAGQNLEIRRNFYDQSGKDIMAGSKDKQANGEEGATNGAASTESGTKIMEELAKEPKKPVHCFSCGIDCTRIRHHYSKTTPNVAGAAAPKKYDICSNCFQCGRVPTTHSPHDFTTIENPDYTAIPDRDAPWTDSEMLLLLEGLDQFDDDWDEIADHVKTRTREECVLRFLQLEIEDPYLESELNGAGTATLGALNNGRVPFTQADNPVMSVVAFLAGMSEPSVAAAAAGKFTVEVRKNLRNRLENGMGGASQQKGKEKEGVKSEDSMEVDTAMSPQADANNQIATSNHQQQQQPISAPTMAMAATAARATGLASHEEREMSRIVSATVNLTLQKFELKLQQYSEIEATLQAERRELERGRQQLFLDRLAFKKRVREVEEGLKTASLRGGVGGTKMAQEVAEEFGGGERFNFQGERGLVEREVQPPSTGDVDFTSYEI